MAEKIISIENGSSVKLELDLYIGSEMISTTADEGPVEFTMGEGQMVPGLEAALLGLKKGEGFDVIVEPKEAYGDYDEDAYEVLDPEVFEDAEIIEGEDYFFEDENGDMVVISISEITEDGVVADFNHPLAGETLRFKGQVLAVS